MTLQNFFRSHSYFVFVYLFKAIDTLIFFDKTKTTLTSYHIIWRQDWVIIGLATLLLVGGILVLIGYLCVLGQQCCCCIGFPIHL